MPVLRDLIIRRNKKLFQEYCAAALAQKNIEIEKSYAEHQVLVGQLLKKTKYWHGTGRYRYEYIGDSKYNGVHHSTVVDGLNKIFKQRGLLPNYDPWMQKSIGVSHTLSLANQWFYAKLYANNYQSEQQSLQFEIAPAEFWYRIVMWLHTTEHYCVSVIKFMREFVLSAGLRHQALVWLSSFRADAFSRKWPILKLLTARSDIKNNYGIIFGISKNIQTMDLMKEAKFLEARTQEEVSFESSTFMAVPYINVNETKELAKQCSIDVPIIALEWIERHMSQRSFREIIDGNHFHKL